MKEEVREVWEVKEVQDSEVPAIGLFGWVVWRLSLRLKSASGVSALQKREGSLLAAR